MATGDIRGNLDRLHIGLKHIKYPVHVDDVGLRIGDTAAALPLLHYALLGYSKHVALFIIQTGLQLQAKTDQRFVEGAFRLARDQLGIRTVLTPQQFLETGFAERKILLLCDIVAAVRQLHAEQARQEKLRHAKACRASPLKPQPPELREVHVARGSPMGGGRLVELLRPQHAQLATDAAQTLYDVEVAPDDTHLDDQQRFSEVHDDDDVDQNHLTAEQQGAEQQVQTYWQQQAQQRQLEGKEEAEEDQEPQQLHSAPPASSSPAAVHLQEQQAGSLSAAPPPSWRQQQQQDMPTHTLRTGAVTEATNKYQQQQPASTLLEQQKVRSVADVEGLKMGPQPHSHFQGVGADGQTPIAAAEQQQDWVAAAGAAQEMQAPQQQEQQKQQQQQQSLPAVLVQELQRRLASIEAQAAASAAVAQRVQEALQARVTVLEGSVRFLTNQVSALQQKLADGQQPPPQPPQPPPHQQQGVWGGMGDSGARDGSGGVAAPMPRAVALASSYAASPARSAVFSLQSLRTSLVASPWRGPSMSAHAARSSWPGPASAAGPASDAAAVPSAHAAHAAATLPQPLASSPWTSPAPAAAAARRPGNVSVSASPAAAAAAACHAGALDPLVQLAAAPAARPRKLQFGSTEELITGLASRYRDAQSFLAEFSAATAGKRGAGRAPQQR